MPGTLIAMAALASLCAWAVLFAFRPTEYRGSSMMRTLTVNIVVTVKAVIATIDTAPIKQEQQSLEGKPC